MSVRGLFVTGTDTDVGKTILAGALLAAISSAGVHVRAHKPVVTGLDESPATSWPPDHELLAAAAGMDPRDVSPHLFGPAVSPHLAAALAGTPVERRDVIEAARAGIRTRGWRDQGNVDVPRQQGDGDARATDAKGQKTHAPEIVIVEGVGGLMTPLADDLSVRDLAVALDLPVLIAARPGLGTINHTLLTLACARTAELDVLAVVLTPWPADPSQIQRSNRETIARLGEVEVEVLPHVRSPDVSALSNAGGRLPWRRWLETESGDG